MLKIWNYPEICCEDLCSAYSYAESLVYEMRRNYLTSPQDKALCKWKNKNQHSAVLAHFCVEPNKMLICPSMKKVSCDKCVTIDWAGLMTVSSVSQPNDWYEEVIQHLLIAKSATWGFLPFALPLPLLYWMNGSCICPLLEQRSLHESAKKVVSIVICIQASL